MSRRRWWWILVGLVAAAGVLIAGIRHHGPRSPGERAASIAKQVACPTCNGESVLESNATAARGIRNEITALVNAGQRSDAEIIADITQRFPGSSMVPMSSGLESLVWALPAAAAVLAVAGLGYTIRRGRTGRSDGAAAWAVGALAVAGIVGWTVAEIAGSDSTSTGGEAALSSLPAVPASTDPIQIKLGEARDKLATDAGAAAAAYLEVLKLDPQNTEARTYSAWLVTQQGRQTGDDKLVQAGLAALKSAAEHDPTYPDAHCFVAITSARFLTTPDMATAASEGRKCLDLGVPEGMRPMVEALVASASAASASVPAGSTAG